jgi:uncharacterized protein YkwD
MNLSWLHRRICSLLRVSLVIAGLSLLCAQLIPDCRSAEPASLSDVNNYVSDNSLENELLLLTNQQRIRQGLQPLALDSKLTKMAREHSRDMAHQGFISHDQPSGSLRTRMNRAGSLYEVARENVASAQTIARAHAALLNSPPHKENILAGDVTRIGIGVAQCRELCGRQIYVTELFADSRDEYQPEMVQALLADRIDQLRQKGAGSMQSNPALDEIAARSVQSLSIPYNREDLKNLVAASANDLQEADRAKLSRMEVDVQIIHNPKKLSIPAMERQGQARIYGSAVRTVTDSQNQTAFLVLTLIGITR